MPISVDTTYRFHTDTPKGKDPDSRSKTLKEYHRLLWSKPLPSGEQVSLLNRKGAYLEYVAPSGKVFDLRSDAITNRLRKKAAKLIERINSSELPEDLGYTIGSAILFPGNQIDGKQTINQQRGTTHEISDRFDLTLECIRRHFLDVESPLSDLLERYSDFFDLFGSFKEYVKFFLLDDLVNDGYTEVKFFHKFDDFKSPAVPTTVDDYIAYVNASNDFIVARNKRIAEYCKSQ